MGTGEKTVNLNIKAVDQASAEMARIAAQAEKFNRAITASGTASAAAKRQTSELLDRLRAGRRDIDDASGGMDNLGGSAKRAAKGGMQELANQVPVVGGVLGDLAGQLKGFPLLLGGIVGAGIGVISFLKSLQSDATKALDSMTALADGVGRKFTQAVLAADKAAAESRHDRVAAIELGYKAEVKAAQDAAADKIKAAKAEFDAVDQAFFTTYDQRQAALATYHGKVAAANGEAAADEIRLEAQKNAQLVALAEQRLDAVKDLYAGLRTAQADANAAELEAQGKQTAALEVGIEEQKNAAIEGYNKQIEALEKLGIRGEELNTLRRAADEKLQADLVKIEADGAEKRKAILEGLTTAAIGITEKLGSQFAKLNEKLNAAAYIQGAQNQIKQLEGLKNAIRAGDETFKALGITEKDLTDVQQKLTEKIDETRTKGVVPLTQATEALAVAEQKAVDGGEAWLRSIQGISPALDAIIAKTRAAASAISSVGGGGGGVLPGTASLGGGTGTVLGPAASGGGGVLPGTASLGGGSGTVLGSILNPIPSFAGGGVMPGPIGKPGLAVVHGGETITPPSGSARPTMVLHVHPGAVQVQGQASERDYRTAVEILAQDIESRFRRVYG